MLRVASKMVVKFIWDSKGRFSLPNINQFKISVGLELASVADINMKFKHNLINSGLQYMALQTADRQLTL
jgi:hypothetical protein